MLFYYYKAYIETYKNDRETYKKGVERMIRYTYFNGFKYKFYPTSEDIKESNLKLSNTLDVICPYCLRDKRIRNPSGYCDHLYYPENVNKELLKGGKSK